VDKKYLNIKDYVLDTNYEAEKMEYDEEVDGNLFPSQIITTIVNNAGRDKYKNIKNSIAKSRVRR